MPPRLEIMLVRLIPRAGLPPHPAALASMMAFAPPHPTAFPRERRADQLVAPGVSFLFRTTSKVGHISEPGPGGRKRTLILERHYGNFIASANVDGNFDKRGLPDPLVLAFYFTAHSNLIVQLII